MVDDKNMTRQKFDDWFADDSEEEEDSKINSIPSLFWNPKVKILIFVILLLLYIGEKQSKCS